MSKIDDLEDLFDSEFRKYPAFRRQGKRAGIIAVVRALRDEIWPDKYVSGPDWDIGDAVRVLDKILGDAGERVAEPTVGQRLIKAAHEAAAIARGEGGDATPTTDPECVACRGTGFIYVRTTHDPDGPRECETCEECAPAAPTTAPETCEWVPDNFGRMQHWQPACEPDALVSGPDSQGNCYICGKPIKFKENKT